MASIAVPQGFPNVTKDVYINKLHTVGLKSKTPVKVYYGGYVEGGDGTVSSLRFDPDNVVGQIYPDEVFYSCGGYTDFGRPINQDSKLCSGYWVAFRNKAGRLAFGFVVVSCPLQADLRSHVDLRTNSSHFATKLLTQNTTTNGVLKVFIARRDMKIYGRWGTWWGTVKAGQKIGINSTTTELRSMDNEHFRIPIHGITNSETGGWVSISKDGANVGYIDPQFLKNGASGDNFGIVGKNVDGTIEPTPEPPKYDRYKPQVWFNGLSDGKKISGDFLNLSIGYSDNMALQSGAEMKVIFDGHTVKKIESGDPTPDGHSTYFHGENSGKVEFTLDLSNEADGDYSIGVELKDSAGNESGVEEIEFKLKRNISGKKPSCWINTPTTSFPAVRTPISMTFDNDEPFPAGSAAAIYSGDPDKPQSICLWRKDDLQGGTPSNARYRVTDSFDVNLQKLDPGIYCLHLRVWDGQYTSDMYIKEMIINEPQEGSVVWHLLPPDRITGQVQIGARMFDPTKQAYKAELWINNEKVDTNFIYGDSNDHIEKFTIPAESLSLKKKVKVEIMFVDGNGREMGSVSKRCYIGGRVYSDFIQFANAKGVVRNNRDYRANEMGDAVPSVWYQASTWIDVWVQDRSFGGGKIELLVSDCQLVTVNIPSGATSFATRLQIPDWAPKYENVDVEIRVTNRWGSWWQYGKTNCDVGEFDLKSTAPIDLTVKVLEETDDFIKFDVKATTPVDCLHQLYIDWKWTQNSETELYNYEEEFGSNYSLSKVLTIDKNWMRQFMIDTKAANEAQWGHECDYPMTRIRFYACTNSIPVQYSANFDYYVNVGIDTLPPTLDVDTTKKTDRYTLDITADDDQELACVIVKDDYGRTLATIDAADMQNI